MAKPQTPGQDVTEPNSCHIYSFPYFADLTGAQDGSVRMFEWGHSQQIICFRSPGNSRITRIRFNHQGNKVTQPHTQMLNALGHSWSSLNRHHTDVKLFLALKHDCIMMCACQLQQHFHTSSHNFAIQAQTTEGRLASAHIVLQLSDSTALNSGTRLELIIFSDGASPVPALSYLFWPKE